MQNPFLRKRSYTITYILVWIALMAIHTLVLWFALMIEPVTAIVDSLVFNLIFAALGVSIWFTVRFSSSRSGRPTDQIMNHAFSGLVMISLWLGLGYLIMNWLYTDEAYLTFLQASVLGRALTGVFYFSLLVMVYYLYINGEDRKARISREHDLRMKVREAEIDRLKAQINPHFLFNSLNSISAMIKHQPEDAREMVIKLSSFLRYSLEHKENELTTLQHELEHIARYLDIEKARFGDRLVFNPSVEKSCESLLLPHMILQPLIENAIKHGVYESTEPVTITLRASCTPASQMLIEISNNFDPEAPPRKGKGIGLTNTQNRLKLVYGSDSLMQIHRSGDRFEIKTTFPQTLPS